MFCGGRGDGTVWAKTAPKERLRAVRFDRQMIVNCYNAIHKEWQFSPEMALYYRGEAVALTRTSASGTKLPPLLAVGEITAASSKIVVHSFVSLLQVTGDFKPISA